jgi:uncharacterized protein (UPF0335 family)
LDILDRIREEISPHLVTLADIDRVAEQDSEAGLQHLARFFASLIRDGATASELREVIARLDRIEKNQEKQMSEQQQDVDAATAQLTATDNDVKALAGQVTAGQQAFDTAIANLEAQIAAGQPVDTSELKAAQAVLAGDQPSLDAAVAALASDPALTPAPGSTQVNPSAGDGTATPSA